MTILINYLNQDKAFINNLVIGISRRRTDHCITAWEMSEGDVLTKELEKEDDSSRVVLVILSKESAASEWCQRGLSAGLLRELEEKGIVVIPVIIEDCELPEFALGKPVADFRMDFEVGLESIMEQVPNAPTRSMPQITEPSYKAGGALELCNVGGRLVILYPFVLVGTSTTYLTYIEIRANEVATRVFEKNMMDSATLHVFEVLNAHLATVSSVAVLQADKPEHNQQLTVHGPFPGEVYSVIMNVRIFGDFGGRKIPVDVSALIADACEELSGALHRPTHSASDQDEQEQRKKLGPVTLR